MDNIPPSTGEQYKSNLEDPPSPYSIPTGHSIKQVSGALALGLNRKSQNQRDLVRHYLNRPGKPVWTLLPEVARACQELLKCGCKSLSICSKKCKCRDAGLSCTGL